MKLVIQGKEYELREGISKATLGDLYVLKVKSGMGVKRIMEVFRGMEKAESHFDLIESEDGIQALRAMIFLCRRAAGEYLDFDEATDFPMSEMGFVVDDEEKSSADPKETPTASAPDEGTPVED
ncbi:hypothetical protein [Arthrobacter sp. MYb213]|uniref:hypothetical protein n=1 Tax=Arthrobacter sp. MYb213 TaxID=1848595 RepID=UPI000CFE326F|nr:hypothetical protein [Arthrobacter sp. MYb213]PRB69519.1 hypothetical protein CQ011_12210 [Arthrobacter sp. MYb213]